MFNEIKYFIQRGKMGYSDRDKWDISSYWGEIMPALLRTLKESRGCPSDFYDSERVNDECWKWNEALEEMAQGFEAANWIKNNTACRKLVLNEKGEKELSYDWKSVEQAEEKMKKGLQLFVNNYLSLWD
jgi:hypothetical protein